MYDVIIVGGGIAGLQAAIQLGRYQHQVLVIDAGVGRSTLCQSYHNVLGYPSGVSGGELRSLGQRHAQELGVHFVVGEVTVASKGAEGFKVKTSDQEEYMSRRILLATGVMDQIPPFPELIPCLGLSVYVCPDCDGYEIKDKRTLVLGSGKVGANMALTLTYWTDQLVLINHGQAEIPEKERAALQEKNIEVISIPIAHVRTGKHWEFTGVELEDGRVIRGEGGFIAFGGNEVKSQLARQLGVELLENHHILVDPRTKMTNVQYVWAAGDVVAHSEQVTIAMGEGSQAAIWIHKSLM